VLSAYASVCPAGIRPAAEARIQRLTRDIARGFGLRTTPLLVQFMVDGDDVRLIEFAPRVGGGLNYRVVLLHSGIDIVDAAVDAFLGRSTALAAARSGGYIATHHVYTEAGRFGQVRNHERLVEEGIVAEFYVNKTRGAPIGAGMTSADRVASFIVLAQSAEELLRRVREAMQRIDVVDVDGRSIIRRHVYLKAL
jgi:phosphoribosylamine-glycine ligase